jgi:hypothetical protein
MKRATRLIGAVAIAITLVVAFSGVAAASWLVEYTPEKQAVWTPVNIVDWKSSSEKTTLAFEKVATNRNLNLHGYTSKWNELGLLPMASSDEMKAYSKLLATDVQATTRAEVGMTDNPASSYKIDVKGLNEGSMAKGRISAGMSVYVVGDPILSYEERSSASGLFQFHKEMSYTSKITTP